jgi:hypothetical protein
LSQKKTSQPVAPAFTATRIWFDIALAADYACVTVSCVEHELRSGKLPYRWVGNKRVIHLDDIDRWVLSFPVERGLCDKPAFLDKKRLSAVAAD